MKLRVKSRIGEEEDIKIEKKDHYTTSEMDRMYRKVRDYLYDHQGENAIKVSEDTGVPREIIMTFLRQGKISLAENGKSWLRNCKSCGALIETGDICIECMQKRMHKILNPEVAQTSRRQISGHSSRSIGNQELGYGRRIRKK